VGPGADTEESRAHQLTTRGRTTRSLRVCGEALLEGVQREREWIVREPEASFGRGANDVEKINDESAKKSGRRDAELAAREGGRRESWGGWIKLPQSMLMA